MGEVYRATDMRLDREVAIKVLPSTWAQDKERLARFEREAKVLAQLSHGNVASVHGFDEHEGMWFLVMEHVEGEDLSERLKRGKLSIDETIDLGQQIAEALEAAHAKGIIHRDLKPANIKLSPEGKVKVLDFGLAKAMVVDSDEVGRSSHGEGEEGEQGWDASATLTDAFTKPGTILGTAAYMSPEQAKGQALDERTDVWAFGCVLFECLTGSRAFPGDDMTETLAAIVRGEPNWGLLPRETSVLLASTLRKCLAKKREQRLRNIADARLDLDLASNVLVEEAERGGKNRKTGVQVGWPLLAGAMAVLALACWVTALLVGRTAAPNEVPESRVYDVLVGDGNRLDAIFLQHSFALSPDGRQLVYTQFATTGLFLRDLVTGDDTRISGTEGLTNNYEFPVTPFFSPDGSKVGFQSGKGLAVIPTSGGQPRFLIGDGLWHTKFSGADWSEDGHIVYTVPGVGVNLIPENGGAPERLLEATSKVSYSFPHFVDGGRQVLVTDLPVTSEKGLLSDSDMPDGEVLVIDVGTKATRRLEIGRWREVRYVPATGHLVCARGLDLYAIPFDWNQMRATGESKLIQSGIRNSGRIQYDFTREGTMAFLPGHDSGERLRGLFWCAPDQSITPFSEHFGPWTGFALAPDEKRAALVMDGDLWILDTRDSMKRPPRPLVRSESDERYPVWSSDGEFVYYQVTRDNQHGVWRKRAKFDGSEEELVFGSGSFYLEPTSASSEFLFLQGVDIENSEGGLDIWRLDLTEPRPVPERLRAAPWADRVPMVSPSGRWIAFMARESESDSYLIQIMPNELGAESQLISLEYGTAPQWASDEKRIYWHSRGAVYSMALKEQEGHLVPTQSEPTQFMNEPFLTSVLFQPSGQRWALARDGQRALLNASDAVTVQNEVTASATPTHLKLVTDWFARLKQLAPSK